MAAIGGYGPNASGTTVTNFPAQQPQLLYPPSGNTPSIDLAAGSDGIGGTVNTHAFRYYRVWTADAGGITGFGAAEIELAVSPSGPDTTLGQTFTSSTNFSGQPASNAFDDNSVTEFATDFVGAQPYWIKVDYGATAGNWVAANELRIRTPATVSHALQDFSWQGSDDNSAWTTLFSIGAQPTWVTNETRIYTATASGSSGVTVALTGLSLSIAQGSLLASTALALTGQSASVAQGSLAPAISAALTGQSLTAAQGTLSPSTSLSLTGQALSVAQGSVTAGLRFALSGLGAGVAQGSLGPSITITLSGQSLSIAQGNVSPSGNVTVALTGLSLSVAQGSVGPSITATITGQSLSAALGSLIASAPVTSVVAAPVFTPPPPQRARTRMHGWRVYQPTPYFAATPPQPLNILPVPIPGVAYIVDANGAYLTDTAGNKIIYG